LTFLFISFEKTKTNNMKKSYSLMFLAYTMLFSANGQMLSFDGVNDYVDLGSNAITGCRTFECWFTPAFTINSSALSDYASLIARDDASQTDEMNISFVPSSAGTLAGKIVFHRNIGGTNHYVYSDNNTWNAGECHHVAGVVDPVAGMMMYIDGVLQANTLASITTAPAAASEITTIGRYGDLSIRYFTGKIDEVRVWTTARTAAEIVSSYNHSMGSAATGLYGYWKLDEGSGSTAFDATTNNNDGTVNGSPAWASSGACLVGIDEEEMAKPQLSVYPNPINYNSVLKINYIDMVEYDLNVTDVSGKLVWSQSSLKTTEISLAALVSLNAGSYFVNLSFPNSNVVPVTTKIMVVK
jgi:hypothetical protein